MFFSRKIFEIVKLNELHQCRLSTAFGDLANTYYRDESRRVKVRLERKSFGSVELNVRYCFKVRSFCHYGTCVFLENQYNESSCPTAVNVKLY